MSSNAVNSSTCGLGCGLFVIKNGIFYLRGIMINSTDRAGSFYDFFRANLQVKTWINYNEELSTSSTPAAKINQPVKHNYCLYADQCIHVGEDMDSYFQCFRLSFRTDGDLYIVRSRLPSIVVWNTGTRGKGGVKACMLRNGDFVMLDWNNGTVWSSGSVVENEQQVVRTCMFDNGFLAILADDKTIYLNEHGYKC